MDRQEKENLQQIVLHFLIVNRVKKMELIKKVNIHPLSYKNLETIFNHSILIYLENVAYMKISEIEI